MYTLVARYIRIVEVRSSNLLCSTTFRPKTQFSDGYFVLSIQKSPVQRLQIAKKGGTSPSGFRDFLDFWHNCPAVAFDELVLKETDIVPRLPPSE